jgi:hypothetical protein
VRDIVKALTKIKRNLITENSAGEAATKGKTINHKEPSAAEPQPKEHKKD